MQAVAAANDVGASPGRNSGSAMDLRETMQLITPAVRHKFQVLVVPLLVLAPLFVLITTLSASTAGAADPDLQLWFPAQFIHPFGDNLSVSMQIEPRLQDDISEFSKLVYKPALNYHFNPTWAFSTGYEYIDKYHRSNEQDIWQEGHYNKKYGDLVTGFQLRLEERFIDDMDGVIPRLRVLQHVSHPIGESPLYLTGFGAI
jgi:hypothetical protein